MIHCTDRYRARIAAVCLLGWSGAAATTNSSTVLLASPSLPDAGPSLLRVLGALALVLGLFLGGVWMFRNGRRVLWRRAGAPRLRVLESQYLGGRQALHVVAYDQQRFLLASSATGISLLSQLPGQTETVSEPALETGSSPSFSEALMLVLKGQSAASGHGGSK